jgi:hypothetical protein
MLCDVMCLQVQWAVLHALLLHTVYSGLDQKHQDVCMLYLQCIFNDGIFNEERLYPLLIVSQNKTIDTTFTLQCSL